MNITGVVYSECVVLFKYEFCERKIILSLEILHSKGTLFPPRNNANKIQVIENINHVTNHLVNTGYDIIIPLKINFNISHIIFGCL